MIVVYLDQLLGTANTQRLVKLLFFTETGLKLTKKVENGLLASFKPITLVNGR